MPTKRKKEELSNVFRSYKNKRLPINYAFMKKIIVHIRTSGFADMGSFVPRASGLDSSRTC